MLQQDDSRGKNEPVCFGNVCWQLPVEGGRDHTGLVFPSPCTGSVHVVTLGHSFRISSGGTVWPWAWSLSPSSSISTGKGEPSQPRLCPFLAQHFLSRVFLAASNEALQPSTRLLFFAAVIHHCLSREKVPNPMGWRQGLDSMALTRPFFTLHSKCTSSWTKH